MSTAEKLSKPSEVVATSHLLRSMSIGCRAAAPGLVGVTELVQKCRALLWAAFFLNCFLHRAVPTR